MKEEPLVMTTAPERRQIARTRVFPRDLAPYINWDAIAREARELGSDFEVRNDDGGTTITWFWAYLED